MSQKEYLSKEKFAELQRELEELITVKRKQIAEELEYAKSLGDLSENAEYQDARLAQAQLEERIAQIESSLANAEIMKAHHSTAVEVGSTVHVTKKGDKTERVFTIVGTEEADTTINKISFKSPLGAALLGKKQGDECTFSAPVGAITYIIKKID